MLIENNQTGINLEYIFSIRHALAASERLDIHDFICLSIGTYLLQMLPINYAVTDTSLVHSSPRYSQINCHSGQNILSNNFYTAAAFFQVVKARSRKNWQFTE